MPVCVAGMHRSGTSLVARALNLAGLYLGAPEEMMPAAPDNPEGFWENLRFVELNDSLIRASGGAWDCPRRLPRDWARRVRYRVLERQARALARDYQVHEPWGWKDPRNCLTLPFWTSVVPDLRVVVCIRNPLEVLRSLQVRNHNSFTFCLRMWKSYTRSLLESSTSSRRLVTMHEAYFSDPERELRRLLSFAGLPATPEILELCRSSISPALRHHRSTADEMKLTVDDPSVLTLWAMLKKEAEGVADAPAPATVENTTLTPRLLFAVAPTRRPRLMVACASPPQFNPGMHCVDLALDAFLSRHQLDVEVDRRVLYTPHDLYRSGLGGSADDFGLPLRYRRFQDSPDPVRGADALLFWGDFLHSRHYRQAVARLMVRCGVAADDESALYAVDRHLFLATDEPTAAARALVFGESLLTDGSDAVPGDAYDRNLTALFRSVRDVWMRDTVSAARAANLRGSPPASHLGVDCALLLRRTDCEALAGSEAHSTPRDSHRAGVFFARTREDPSVLIRFADALCRQLAMEPAWLPWLPTGPATEAAVSETWPDQAAGTPVGGLSSTLAALLRCSAVITDVYHLTVLAWNCGIPAVCVGRGATHFRTAVSDKKKELFHLTYGVDGFYVFSEHLPAILGEVSAPGSTEPSLDDLRPPTLAELSGRVADASWASAVQQRIAQCRDAADAQLAVALRGLL